MPLTRDPAMNFLLDHLLPLRAAAGGSYVFDGPDPDAASYFSDCAPDAAGDVRQVPEDVESMLRELAARWRAEGRDDLLVLEAPLQDLAAALLEHVDEGELPELMTASHPLF